MDLFKILTLAGAGTTFVVIARDKKINAKDKAKYMAITAGAAGLMWGGKNVYDEWKRKQDLEQEYAGDVNLSQISTEIYDAFWNNDYFGVTEDEEAAIAALKQVPKEYVNSLALVYNRMYDKNLREDFKFYLSNEQYQEVKAWLQ